MKDWIKKNILLVLLIGSVLFFGIDKTTSLVKELKSNDLVENMELSEVASEGLSTLLGGVLDTALDKRLTPIEKTVSDIQESLTSGPNLAVITLELDLNQFTTAEEVDIMVDNWLDGGWTAQQGMAKYIIADKNAREQLECEIVYTEVFKRFILRARRIP